jgi:hypothetical protein
LQKDKEPTVEFEYLIVEAKPFWFDFRYWHQNNINGRINKRIFIHIVR